MDRALAKERAVDSGVEKRGAPPDSRSQPGFSSHRRPAILEGTDAVRSAYTQDDCPACYRPLVVSFPDARPAGEVIQELYGCDVDDLHRFFAPDEWLTRFELPLWLIWGTAEEWQAIATIWRETRAKKRGPRFMSLDEISAQWDKSGSHSR
jgi:hypothetical protein